MSLAEFILDTDILSVLMRKNAAVLAKASVYVSEHRQFTISIITRYEILRGDELVGEIRYRIEPGAIVLVHTDVAPSAEGQGIGSRLVAGALDDIRSRGLRVVPVCPFVTAYLRRHPEQRDLVVPDPAVS